MGHCVGKHNIVLENRQGLLAGDLTGLKLEVEECPGGPHEPKLKADQMAVGWLVRFHEPFGVESPALDVGAIEGKGSAGVGDALFDDGRKLKLVAGRASWAVNVHEAAAKLKSSNFCIFPDPSGTLSGRTNSPTSPVLPISRGGCILGAAWPRFRPRWRSGCARHARAN